MDTIKTFWRNLSKNQRFAVIGVAEFVIVLILAACLGANLGERTHVNIENSDQASSMPSAAKEAYQDALWNIIKLGVKDIDRSVINDATIRENSYHEEFIEDSDNTQASFLVDIDSIKQTYRVTIGWSKNGSDITETVIDCPTKSESRYPDSVCVGTYRDSSDLSLYIPYSIPAPQNNGANDVDITMNEEAHEIYVNIADCKADDLRKKAEDYLSSIPIDLSDYQIKYEVSSLDGGYFDSLNDAEINVINNRCGIYE